MIKGIGYIRVSTEDQATLGVSLAAQKEKIVTYCGLYDIDLVGVISDAGVSAKTMDRPGLAAALGMLDSGTVGCLVIAKLDRLTRSVRDLSVILDHFDQDGRSGKPSLLSVSDQIDTRTANGRMMLNLLVTVSQWEREVISERTKTALAHKRAHGKVTGSVPWGYSRVGDALVPNEAEVKITLRAKELYDQMYSLQEVSDLLSKEGIKARNGRPFFPQQIRSMVGTGASQRIPRMRGGVSKKQKETAIV